MPTPASFTRQLLIVTRLEAKPYSSFENLHSYVIRQLEHQQLMNEKLKTDFTDRTFQRDKRDIYKSFGIAIEYSAKEKGHFISNRSTEKDGFQRLKEAYELQNALNLSQSLSAFVHLEKRRPLGTENLHHFIYAIKKKLEVLFEHENYWDEALTQRMVDPYGLIESKHRWYVIAKDHKDGAIKTFGLDRITNFEITDRKFKPAPEFNVSAYFHYCFGIIRPNDEEPQNIILSFEANQGKYIKSFPLHHTQQILEDNEDEFRIQLQLYITDDLIMELLSYSGSMKIIQPQGLIQDVKTALEKATQQY